MSMRLVLMNFYDIDYYHVTKPLSGFNSIETPRLWHPSLKNRG